jgi:hypothetical protein
MHEEFNTVGGRNGEIGYERGRGVVYGKWVEVSGSSGSDVSFG